MGRIKQSKYLLAIIAGLLLVIFAALPALGASANTQAVLDRLAVLQRADINPDWPPDVEANLAAVEGLLSLYKACTPEERKEFTPEQNKALRAYFTTLYGIQGKSTTELDALFSSEPSSASTPASSSGPAASSSVSSASASSVASSSASVSSAAASSSLAASSSASSVSPASSPSSSAPVVSSTFSSASSTPPAEEPTSHTPPPAPRNTFFANRGTGAILLLALFSCLALVFLRFLVAVGAAHKSAKKNQPHKSLEQELFGENYGGQLTGGQPDELGVVPAEGEASLRALNPRSRGKQKFRGMPIDNDLIEENSPLEDTAPPESPPAPALEQAPSPKATLAETEHKTPQEPHQPPPPTPPAKPAEPVYTPSGGMTLNSFKNNSEIIPKKYNKNTSHAGAAPIAVPPATAATPVQAPGKDPASHENSPAKPPPAEGPDALFNMLRANPLEPPAPKPLNTQPAAGPHKPRTGRPAPMPYHPEDVDELDEE